MSGELGAEDGGYAALQEHFLGQYGGLQQLSPWCVLCRAYLSVGDMCW